jgi:[ribosomal protein S18]-alanine N-acetyltransferase
MMASPHGAQIFLRPMTLADLAQVNEIEQVSFSTPWPENAFHYELTQNQSALCWVAAWTEHGQAPIVVADIVVWLILDEAHIGTLAVHPNYRGRGIAQRLLARALLESVVGGATHAYLEVRASNQAAQNLYEKFGFERVGIRPKYYQDNQEDAVMMTLTPLATEKLAQLAQPG